MTKSEFSSPGRAMLLIVLLGLMALMFTGVFYAGEMAFGASAQAATTIELVEFEEIEEITMDCIQDETSRLCWGEITIRR